jgi:hypothetical protein
MPLVVPKGVAVTMGQIAVVMTSWASVQSSSVVIRVKIFILKRKGYSVEKWAAAD